MEGELPRSWRHFALGIRWLEAKQSRDAIMDYQSHFMSQVSKEDREAWLQPHLAAARWLTLED